MNFKPDSLHNLPHEEKPVSQETAAALFAKLKEVVEKGLPLESETPLVSSRLNKLEATSKTEKPLKPAGGWLAEHEENQYKAAEQFHEMKSKQEAA